MQSEEDSGGRTLVNELRIIQSWCGCMFRTFQGRNSGESVCGWMRTRWSGSENLKQPQQTIINDPWSQRIKRLIEDEKRPGSASSFPGWCSDLREEGDHTSKDNKRMQKGRQIRFPWTSMRISWANDRPQANGYKWCRALRVPLWLLPFCRWLELFLFTKYRKKRKPSLTWND